MASRASTTTHPRPTAGSGSSAVAAPARRRADQGFAVLQKLLPLASRLVRWVRGYTFVTAVAIGVIVGSVAWITWPESLVELMGLLAFAGLLSAPIVMLWLFGSALQEVVELPRRLGSVPELARTHGPELLALAARGDAGRKGSVLGDTWRAGRLMLGARRNLPGYGAALTLVSPTFLIASLAAALAAVWLILLAVPVFVVAAVASVL
jgi:hypothetical protein